MAIPNRTIPIMAGAVGLDTVHEADDILYNPESGISALSKAVNVKVERSGRKIYKVSRVFGFTEVLTTGSFHSGFRNGGDAFVGVGTALYRFNEDETITGVRTSLSGDWICFAQHGDDTYYSNGLQNGIITNAVSREWAKQTYLGPDSNIELSKAPLARHMGIFNGRMFISPLNDRRVLYASELHQFGLFAMGRNFWEFESDIIMILPVEDGILISTRHKIYFMQEIGPVTFKLRERTTYPAIERSQWHTTVDGKKIGFESNIPCVLFRSEEGACLGTPDGQVKNITESMIEKTACKGFGASALVGPYFIHSIG